MCILPTSIMYDCCWLTTTTSTSNNIMLLISMCSMWLMTLLPSGSLLCPSFANNFGIFNKLITTFSLKKRLIYYYINILIRIMTLVSSSSSSSSSSVCWRKCPGRFPIILIKKYIFFFEKQKFNKSQTYFHSFLIHYRLHHFYL